ncbi:SDR family oxidoreductase [Croceimicrobium sp.]|uniref:SDR family oxidoreductase n=1 Tax=Croceimicrobium sp. TaxID=2828340 RepID=UPI003BA94F1E
MEKRKIVVLGANGKTGRKVADILESRGENVVRGSRQASPPFDWHQPEQWSEVLRGAERMYITYQPDLAVPGALEAIEKLVEVARIEGLQKLVLLSGKGEKEAELCEQVIINSGIDYTIVRASWFNQNFSESFFLPAILSGDVALPMAQAKVPYVDTDDIAAVVAKVLMDTKHNGQIYELTGPRLLTFQQVMEEIAVASGRSISFTPISLPAYISMLEDLRVEKDFIWLIQYLFTEVLLEPKNAILSTDIRKVLGRSPKDFRQFAAEQAALGIWTPH